MASSLGDLDIADDAVQDALLDATRSWPERGVPNNPGGWLMTVARRRALDHIRSRNRQQNNLRRFAHELHERIQPADRRGGDMITEGNSLSTKDERLRLMLLCCHPALGRQAQVALTLRLVGGLTTPEISRAFLVPESTLAQRIVRAKKKIRTAKIPMTWPPRIDERLDSLLAVLYLVFNEGYLSSSAAGEPTRTDLTDEAIRLTRLVTALAPQSVEAVGLLALELFHTARWQTRFDRSGDLVLLEDQDRGLWNQSLIAEANHHLATALERIEPGPYQLQAVIAAQHANARTWTETDWPRIAALYDQLDAMSDSPVVSLNRAVAIAMADGPHAGLRIIDGLEGLDSYHLYWATKGELHHRAGERPKCVAAFTTALGLPTSAAERRHLEKRLAEVGRP